MNIQLKHINCFYGTQQALFDINLKSSAGEVLVLLGPSGAGKSSLLRVFNLLEIPANGEMVIADHHFTFQTKPVESQIIKLRQDVGMIFQQYNLWPHLTVLQNLIEAPCRVLKLTKTEAIEQAEQLLTRLQLTSLSERYPLQLSGGQQQRVAIARALMMKPKILLFDEPTAALDPGITAQVAEIINELSQTGITQIVVTHEIEFAKKIASQLAYLEQGRIVEQGDVNHLNHPQTEQFAAYLSY